MRVSFVAEAERELVDAADWYFFQRPGLDLEFLGEVNSVIERIKDNPALFPVVKGSVRRAVVSRFPYLVLFRLLQDSIQVIAIFHAKRNPRAWLKRSQKEGNP